MGLYRWGIKLRKYVMSQNGAAIRMGEGKVLCCHEARNRSADYG